MSTTPTDRSPDAIRNRYQALFGNAFMPSIRHEQTSGADERVALASEYAAFRLGQIDEKLGRLIELMETRDAQRA
jgi:hypothetical protein